MENAEILDISESLRGKKIESVDYKVTFEKYTPKDKYIKKDREYLPLAFGFREFKMIFGAEDQFVIQSIGTVDFQSEILHIIPSKKTVKKGGECTVYNDYEVIDEISGKTIQKVIIDKDILGVITRSVLSFDDDTSLEFRGQLRLLVNKERLGTTFRKI